MSDHEAQRHPQQSSHPREGGDQNAQIPASAGMTKPKRRLWVIVIWIFIGLLAFFFLSKNLRFVGGFPMFKGKDREAEKKSISEIPVPVKAFKVAIIDFTDILPSLGTIKGYREIELKFSESGYIEYVNFKDGEKVVEGDIIASQDQRESLLKLEYAKNEVEKNQKLFDIGAIIEVKLNQSKLEYQSARMDYEKTNLTAPYDGYVGTIDVQKGSFVSPNDKVGTFVNLSDAYVEFGIIEKDIAKVRIGQKISMTVDAYSQDVFSGEIESVSPIVEGKSRTFKVKARVTNENEKLKAGMFGRVGVLIYEKDNALVIPSASFRKKEEEFFVYVVHLESAESAEPVMEGLPQEEPKAGGDNNIGTIEIRPIQIAYTTPDAVEVKAGLEEGELIVADLQQELEEKARVEVTEVQENIF